VHYLLGSGRLLTGPFDATICRNAEINDISEDKIRWFLTRARNTRNYALAEMTPVADVLTHLNLLEKGKPNHAAILLFGLKPQRFLVTSEVKCMHFHGKQKLKPIPSYQIYKGTVFDMVDQSVDFVMSKLNRSVGTRAQGPQAPVEYDIPQEVVVEGIVNAVAHRDYTSNASVEIMLFADRFEVWNPGTLPPSLTIESLSKPHSSQPGNPLIAYPLFLTKYIEKAGTGTVDMFDNCRKAGLRPPVFRLENDFFILTVWRKKDLGKPESPTKSPTKSPTQSADPISRVLTYTIPDKPNSRLQKYRLTKKGEEYLRKQGKRN
jgi:predicted HTH transcriptional regulator